MVKWKPGATKYYIESVPPRFVICKARMGNAHRTYFKYTLADGQTMVGTYDSAEEAKKVAEGMA